MKAERNVPCPCGSGKKYKLCCWEKDQKRNYEKHRDLIIAKELLNKKAIEPNLNMVSSVAAKGYRYRVIWNSIYRRSITETFHEFIMNMLLSLYGEEWRKNEAEKPMESRHILLRWVSSYSDWTNHNMKPKNKDPETKAWRAIPTGEVQALLLFAYDCYCLQLINRLPEHIIIRLKNSNTFQGARYEVAVAAVIARAGFEISFLDEELKSVPHCEFIAIHKQTGQKIGVEAKSKVRAGILNEQGAVVVDEDLKANVHSLFRKARTQKPEGLPYLIFIDLNLPSTSGVPLMDKPWFRDINNMLDNYYSRFNSNPDPFNALIFTNYSYHYGGNEGAAPGGEFAVYPTPLPETPLKDSNVFDYIIESLNRYPYVPKEV